MSTRFNPPSFTKAALSLKEHSTAVNRWILSLPADEIKDLTMEDSNSLVPAGEKSFEKSLELLREHSGP